MRSVRKNSLWSAAACFLLLLSGWGRAVAQEQPADMLERVLGAVVTVAVYETDVTKQALGFRGAAPVDIAYARMLDLSGASGSGSGFVIQREGHKYVVTNAHVVEQAADEDGSIYVYSITREKYAARILGGDSFYDLAVLEFEDEPGAEVAALSFRESEIRVGEPVYAIGNPLGEYPYSVSEGIISAKNRVRGGLTGKFGFLQTTATIIWGNSGGPLVDRNGKVAGINSQIAFTTMESMPVWQSQINFALEAGIASRLVRDILENEGLVRRAYIGLTVSQDVPAVAPGEPHYRTATGNAAVRQYPFISGLLPSSPAEGALKGKMGYRILAVNGSETRNVEEVLGEFEHLLPGETVRLTLQKAEGAPEEEVRFKTASLNASRSIEMTHYLARLEGWTLRQENNEVIVSFNAAGRTGTTSVTVRNSRFRKKEPPGERAAGEWVILGLGSVGETPDLWKVSEMPDVAIAARLMALSGGFDLVLFRKGGNPENERDYLRKTVAFSDDDYIQRQTLLY